MNNDEQYKKAAEAFISASLDHPAIAQSFLQQIPEHLRENVDLDTLKEIAKATLIK